MRPIAHSMCISVFHRIEVNIIDMAREIGVVTDGVLPVATLPDSFLALGDFAGASPDIAGEPARETALDEAPAERKIRVTLREGPHSVQVIRQHADCNRLEWIPF